MAVKIKIRSPQTIGVESPAPGTLTFHLTFSVSLQVEGGSASGAAPVANGPRHCGQNWVAVEVVAPNAAGASERARTTANNEMGFMVGNAYLNAIAE